MRIAITGAAGLLGRALIEVASGKHEVVAAYHSAEIFDRKFLIQQHLDLTSKSSIRQFVDFANADLFIHTAAITDVDLCEREPRRAQQINADATGHLVDALRSTSARILYISTDYVFDGTNGPYAETDATNPINVYGKTKLEGETAIISLDERGCVVRSASFLGHGTSERPTFVDRMLGTMRDCPPLLAANDQCSNVTPIGELAGGVMCAIEAGASGIWHIAHPEIVSRYDLASLIAKSSGMELSRIQSVGYHSLQRDAERPLNGGLKVDKALSVLGISFVPLTESVNGFVQPK